jgi:hypothetical protein
VKEEVRKCNFMQQARGFQREVGCPLDHCSCGTHDTTQSHHKCPPEPHECSGDFGRCHACQEQERKDEIRAAELAAGWDPSP